MIKIAKVKLYNIFISRDHAGILYSRKRCRLAVFFKDSICWFIFRYLFHKKM